jgi:hypothetical protein
MNVSNESQGQRQTILKQFQTMIESRNFVTHFSNIIKRNARFFIQFRQQQSEREDCVPSITDDSTASFQTYE